MFLLVHNVIYFQDRDKMYLTRTVIFQLVQALKFKSSLPDENFLLLVQVGYSRTSVAQTPFGP